MCWRTLTWSPSSSSSSHSPLLQASCFLFCSMGWRANTCARLVLLLFRVRVCWCGSVLLLREWRILHSCSSYCLKKSQTDCCKEGEFWNLSMIFVLLLLLLLLERERERERVLTVCKNMDRWRQSWCANLPKSIHMSHKSVWDQSSSLLLPRLHSEQWWEDRWGWRWCSQETR
jgi:hypothetical protein